MPDQCESPVDAVRARIAARRATLQPAAPNEALPGAVCDGWGLVPVLASDGSGYEPAACLGCELCHVSEPVRERRDPFARLPQLMDEDPM
jgi:hypothetical protein